MKSPICLLLILGLGSLGCGGATRSAGATGEGGTGGMLSPGNPGNDAAGDAAADGSAGAAGLDTHTNGWDYGTGQLSITLYGSYCDKAKAGMLADVQAIFACPGSNGMAVPEGRD